MFDPDTSAPPRPNQYVGSPVERIEDDRLLRGEGTFVADVNAPDMLHAVIFRSSVAHAIIRSLDTNAAQNARGVIAVLTHADLPKPIARIPLRQQPLPEGDPYLQPVIASDRVRYVGEPIAIVLAENQALAEDAVELIKIDFEELPAVVTTSDAATSKTLLFSDTHTNLTYTMKARKGDAAQAFLNAAYTRRETFGVQRHMASPMETRGLMADWDSTSRRLSVYGAAKVPFFNRSLLARLLGMEIGAVDYIEVDVGGGFGARGEFYPEDFLIPFTARAVSRPVRWIEDRREHFLATNHAREVEAEIEIACDEDGRVIGLRGGMDVNLGAYVRTNGFTAPRNLAQFCSGPYDVENIELDARVYVTNKSPAGTYRGPGRFESAFFMERLLEMAAHDLGIDPAEIRRRNLIAEEKMPYKLARMGHIDPSSETWCDGGAYAEVFERCLESFGWVEKQRLQGQLVDGRYNGLGLGCFIEGGAAGPREGARLLLDTDGSLSVFVGSSGLGQGLETILCQIAADALSLPMERISIHHGSTTLVSEGFGSFHSRSTVMGGSAVLEASQLLVEAIRVRGAMWAGCAPEDVRFIDGRVLADGVELDLSALGQIAVEHAYSNSKHTYSYGSHAVHVAIDPATGDVEILDYCTVEDVGRVINPATLHGQVLGSAYQGFGSVFLEELLYDENGQLLTGTFADYILPSATDFIAPRSISLGLRPCPNNPLGAKGAGEGGLIAVGGAVGNAIAAALRGRGGEPNRLPFSPNRIWRLLNPDKGTRTG